MLKNINEMPINLSSKNFHKFEGCAKKSTFCVVAKLVCDWLLARLFVFTALVVAVLDEDDVICLRNWGSNTLRTLSTWIAFLSSSFLNTFSRLSNRFATWNKDNTMKRKRSFDWWSKWTHKERLVIFQFDEHIATDVIESQAWFRKQLFFESSLT